MAEQLKQKYVEMTKLKSMFLALSRQVIVSGKLRAQRAKSMKFKDGYRISSSQPVNEYIDSAVRHVLLGQQHNTELVVDVVRQQFKKHMHETDPEKIQKLKDDAARGLINHILYESEKLSGRKFTSS